MARWRLTEAHYIYTEPGIKWEYIETDRTTGRQVRKQYDVPQYFHHEAEGDWTDKVNNWVVVSDGHNAQPRDIIFKGDPTPGMHPLDDEATEITLKFKGKWGLPDQIFSLASPGSYSTNLTDYFVQQQDKVNTQMADLAQKNTQGFGEFMQSMTAMMQQNQKILEMLAIKASGATPVVDDLEPLEEPDATEKPSREDNRRPASAGGRPGRRF
jgi:hypothetical protein